METATASPLPSHTEREKLCSPTPEESGPQAAWPPPGALAATQEVGGAALTPAVLTPPQQGQVVQTSHSQCLCLGP